MSGSEKFSRFFRSAVEKKLCHFSMKWATFKLNGRPRKVAQPKFQQAAMEFRRSFGEGRKRHRTKLVTMAIIKFCLIDSRKLKAEAPGKLHKHATCSVKLVGIVRLYPLRGWPLWVGQVGCGWQHWFWRLSIVAGHELGSNEGQRVLVSALRNLSWLIEY